DHHQLMHSHRASTGVSLAMRAANWLAQAEDLILFNGENAVRNSQLFQDGGLVQKLDPSLQTNVGKGLLNINSSGDITLPENQIVFVRPKLDKDGKPLTPLVYSENTLNAVAEAFSTLQGLGHYEHYALALNTMPYADLHKAL